MNKSFEDQLGQYFKEDNIEIKNDNIENIVSKNEQDIITARKNKFTSKLKKKRKDNNKRARASRKRNR